MKELNKLYSNPLPASRSGALYNAFPYPTKISPEAIAIYIACHTKVGATVLDPFSGSGTTGLATLLCDSPTDSMITTAEKLGVKPKWGKRSAVLYELSSLGAFVAHVMCNPPSAKKFKEVATSFLKEAETELEELYSVKDDKGETGKIRYTIWSDVLVCPKCKNEDSFWNAAITKEPLSISDKFKCPTCKYSDSISNIEKATENYFDPVLNKDLTRKKREPAWIYGKTGKRTWNRKASLEDKENLNVMVNNMDRSHIPEYQLNWGILYRKGYHKGITHLHHFYTDRNLIVFSRLWDRIKLVPKEYQDSLRLLLLSYNASHSTLMSRVVMKQKSTDFVITGAQSGVLYISSIPVEKNILEGVKRKITTLSKAFQTVEKSKSTVSVFNKSSTEIDQPTESIDYVFTDPPFGDYIPYSEINQINEAWLGSLTDQTNEVIINNSQDKSIMEYGELMQKVFSEINKVLKPEGKTSLVFHSAKSDVWRALVQSYSHAGFKVAISSILDKVQGSFKQVTSTIKVQGDPLLLLIKDTSVARPKKMDNKKEEASIINSILNQAFNIAIDPNERKIERLFSRYVNACLESGVPVSKNAKEFYSVIEEEIRQLPQPL